MGLQREEVVNIFRKGVLPLTETKLKGNEEVSWCGVNGIIAGVQEIERVREGVVVLMYYAWHIAVIDFIVRI